MSTPMMMTNCPSEETLAAFIDGRLDPESRRRVVEHMSSCADCYSVISAAWDFQAAEPAAVSAAAPVVRGRFGFRTLWVSTAAAAAVGFLIVTGGPLVDDLHRKQQRRKVIDASRALEDRPFQGRLSSEFPYLPPRATFRNADRKEDARTWRLRAIAGELKERTLTDNSADLQRDLAVASLLLGESEDAISALRVVLQTETGNVDLLKAIHASRDVQTLTHLASALHAKGVRHESPQDYAVAGEAALRAWTLEPSSPPVAWNRALTLEALNLRDAAIAAWTSYLQIDPGSEWSQEARRRLALLRARTESSAWENHRRTVLEGHTGQMSLAVREFPQQARSLCEDELLPDWGRAYVSGKSDRAHFLLSTAGIIGKQLAAGGGDLLIADAVTAIGVSARTSRITDVARAFAAHGDARTHYRAGRPRQAVSAFEDAAQIFQQSNIPHAFLAAYQVAVARFALNEFDEAARVLDEIPASAGQRYPALQGRIEWVRSLIEDHHGHPREAYVLQRRALERFRKLGERDSEAALESLMAEVLHRTGDFELALEHHARAMRIRAATGTTARRHLIELAAAFTHLELGHLGVAGVMFDGLIELDDVDQNPVPACVDHSWRGVVFARLGDQVAARNSFRNAARHCDAVKEPAVRDRLTATLSLAVAAAGSSVAGTTDASDNALRIAELSGSRVWRAALLTQSGLREMRGGDPVAAESRLRGAIAEIEAARARVVDPSHAAVATGIDQLGTSLLELLVKQKRTLEALDVAEQVARNDISEAYGTAEGLSNADPRGPRTFSLQALRGSLATDVVVARFVPLPSLTCLWVIRHDGIVFYSLPVERDLLMRQVAEYSDGVREAPSPRSIADLSRPLSRSLLAPWIRSVPAQSTIVFVFGAGLDGIPLASLTNPDGDRLLIQDYGVAAAPNLAWLAGALKTDRERSGSDALFVAASRPAIPALEPLPAAEDEIATASQYYRTPVILYGSGATRKTFLAAAATAGLIHFSGHMLVNERRPLLSQLVLAAQSSSHDPAVLYAHELRPSVFPNCRLLVLSSCEGARNPTQGRSYANTALLSGIPTVVASIWPANDRASAVLFDIFHRELRAGATRVKALSRAQLALSQSADPALHRPLSWAGIRCVGAPGVIFSPG